MDGLPIRCFSCNKVINSKGQPYLDLINNGKTPKEALDILELKRLCCRRMILTHVNITDKFLLYSKNVVKNDNDKSNNNSNNNSNI